MSLLNRLGLKSRPAAAAAATPATPAVTPAATPAAAAPASPNRAAAQALREPMRSREKALDAKLQEVHRAVFKLEDAIDAAGTDQKAALAAKKKELDAHAARMGAQLTQLRADLKAIADPDTKAATHAAILGRNGATGTVSELTVERKGEDRFFGRQEATRTETMVAAGRATIQRDHSAREIGLGGVERRNERSVEQVSVAGRSIGTESATTRLGKDGLSYERLESMQREEDGKTFGASRKQSFKAGLGGASQTETVTASNIDGSSTSRTTSAGIERGKGKLGAKRSETRVETDAAGTTLTETRSVRGGLVADGKGVGAYAEADASVERKTKSGLKLGAQATPSANIHCSVEAQGSTPETYVVKLSVDLGAKLGLSAGLAKGALGGKAGASASAKVWMTQTWGPLPADRAGVYLAAVQSGGQGATGREFEIIRCGLSKSWEAARDLYLGAAADPGAGLDQPGSRETGAQTSVGVNGAVGVNAGAIELEVGAGFESTHSHSLKATRSADGKLSYEGKASDAEKVSGSLKVGVGGVKGGFSASRLDAHATGYVFAEPATAQQREALARCRTQAEFDAYARQYGYEKKTDTRSTTSAQGASLEVPQVKANMDFSHGVERQKVTDKNGKVESEKITGSNGAGLSVEILGKKIGASRKEEAVATIDAEGHAALDVRRTLTETDREKFEKAHLPWLKDKKPGERGALATAAGAEPAAADTDTRNLQGMQVRESDLQQLGGIAANDWGRWMAACPSPSRRTDWARAGAAIRKAGGKPAAVADQMAGFVGGDSNARAEVINMALRDPGDVSAGMRYEFPDGLAGLKSKYDTLVVASCESGVAQLAKEEGGAAKAQEAGRKLMDELEALHVKVSTAQGFKQPAVQAEMLAAIRHRQQKIETEMRRAAGGDSADSRDAVESAYRRLREVCVRHKSSEADVFARLETLYAAKQYRDETLEVARLVKQLRDLHAIWQPDYDEMAGLAQEYGFDPELYGKYRPDLARFARVERGAAPGQASVFGKETADKRKRPVVAAPADPLGDSRKAADAQRSAQARQIAADLKQLYPQAAGAGNRLHKLLQGEPKNAATQAHNLGMPKYLSGVANLKKCASGKDEDLESWGFQACADFRAAIAAFRSGLALYPAQTVGA